MVAKPGVGGPPSAGAEEPWAGVATGGAGSAYGARGAASGAGRGVPGAAGSGPTGEPVAAGRAEHARRILEITIDGNDDYAVITARGAARELARELGFGVVDQTRICAAVSEIVRNAVLYAGRGSVRFIVHSGTEEAGAGPGAATPGGETAGVGPVASGAWSSGRRLRRGLEIIVADDGPGIPDLEAVLRGGVSSGAGFGRGISGSRTLMDEFQISSEPGCGTTVRMCKWLD